MNRAGCEAHKYRDICFSRDDSVAAGDSNLNGSCIILRNVENCEMAEILANEADLP